MRQKEFEVTILRQMMIEYPVWKRIFVQPEAPQIFFWKGMCMFVQSIAKTKSKTINHDEKINFFSFNCHAVFCFCLC